MAQRACRGPEKGRRNERVATGVTAQRVSVDATVVKWNRQGSPPAAAAMRAVDWRLWDLDPKQKTVLAKKNLSGC